MLIDASSKWSNVSLLSTRNHAFAKLISQIIQMRNKLPDYHIKSIRMDNAGEFTSKAFDDYYMAIGIKLEHSVPHVHTQNGLAEALIKRIKFIARPLLQGCNLPTTCWGHAVLHAANLITFDHRPTTSTLLCILCKGRHRKFPTFVGSVARYMYQYHLLSDQRWDRSVSRGYMLVMRLCP